ncbi:hypothetical protein [Edaphobacter modestus]|uniref:hypothetical protein n=1 Tax=Edaphobacter modestus TaxID=388466 RepID=UPI001A920C50|nr:hypothetical protein [Edaphobacter modestus]
MAFALMKGAGLWPHPLTTLRMDSTRSSVPLIHAGGAHQPASSGHRFSNVDLEDAGFEIDGSESLNFIATPVVRHGRPTRLAANNRSEKEIEHECSGNIGEDHYRQLRESDGA